MSYWDRLDKYRMHGPQAVSKFELRPVEDFNRIVGKVVDEELLPLGWSRTKGLAWSRKVQPWAEQVIELQPLKSGVGARWGLRLSFIPALGKRRGGARELHLSYDPLDYQRDVSPWSLSRFATEEELRLDGRALMRRVLPEAESLDGCCRDLHSLLRCFEDKKERKHVRLGFHHYPHEVLAYAAVLGLVGRQDAGLQELAAAFTRLKTTLAEQERFRQALADLWKKGV
jgi:hypothetical protein